MNFIIDGEIAALDPEGKTSFQLLQSYGSGKQTPLVYYAFDLLRLDGTDLGAQPLIERRKLLAKLLKKAPDNIRFSEELQGSREELLGVAQQFQLEGLIAKRPESVYESGRRSGAWVKVKLTQQQEFVIGGYTPPEGSRMYFGSLLVGYYGPSGLLFAGRVGTGFTEKMLADLYHGLQKIKRTTCPFVNLPEKRPGRCGQGITPTVMKRCPLGRASTGRPGQVYGMDERRPAPSTGLPGIANRQTAKRRCSRIDNSEEQQFFVDGSFGFPP